MTLESAELTSKHERPSSQQSVGQPIDTLLMDLDGTLYPIENGYEDHVRCVGSPVWVRPLCSLFMESNALPTAVQTKHIQIHA